MENRLFVGNLAWAAEEEDLKSLFGEHGTVEDVNIMRDKFTGRARGFAFVTMATDEEAERCVDALNDKDFMDRALKVNVAKPRTENPPERRRFSGNNNSGGGYNSRGGNNGNKRRFGGNNRSYDRD